MTNIPGNKPNPYTTTTNVSGETMSITSSRLCLDCGVHPEANSGGICLLCLGFDVEPADNISARVTHGIIINEETQPTDGFRVTLYEEPSGEELESFDYDLSWNEDVAIEDALTDRLVLMSEDVALRRMAQDEMLEESS